MFWQTPSKIDQALCLLRYLTAKVNEMATNQVALDASLATLNADLAALQTGQAALLSKLQSIATSQNIDLSAEIAQVQAVDAALKVITGQDTAATTAPPTDATPAPPVKLPPADGGPIPGPTGTVS